MIIDKTGKFYKNKIPEMEAELYNFEKLYYLYEYSDELQVIIDNPQYPSLLNYIDTGILTKEEMIMALCKQT